METQTKKQSQNFNVANTELLYMSITVQIQKTYCIPLDLLDLQMF